MKPVYKIPIFLPLTHTIGNHLHKRKHLSPIYLHCSLGRTPNNNPYSEYRCLIGNTNDSHNIRAHALYSGILGAFLKQPNDIKNITNSEQPNNDPIHDEIL